MGSNTCPDKSYSYILCREKKKKRFHMYVYILQGELFQTNRTLNTLTLGQKA